MVNTKLIDMADATILSGTEVVYGVQSSTNVKVTADQLWTIPQGTVTAPKLKFGTDTNTGIYQPESTSIAMTLAGKRSLYISASFGAIALGHRSLEAYNSTGQIIGIGPNSLAALTTGTDDIAIGYRAGASLTNGSSCIIIGREALASSTGSTNCIAIGLFALNAYADGAIAFPSQNSIAIGTASLSQLLTGYENVGVGTSTLGVATSSFFCTAIGIEALSGLTTGNSCTGIGLSALLKMTTGNACTGLGVGAGTALQNGDNSVGNISGSFNLYLGVATANGSATQRNQQTIIGANACGTDLDNSCTIGRIGQDTVFMSECIIGPNGLPNGMNAAVVAARTVSSLPAASASIKGARSFVSDATAPTFLGSLTGGGAVICPVICNGSAWVAG